MAFGSRSHPILKASVGMAWGREELGLLPGRVDGLEEAAKARRGHILQVMTLTSKMDTFFLR